MENGDITIFPIQINSKKLKIGETVNLQLRRGEQTGKGKLMVGEAP